MFKFFTKRWVSRLYLERAEEELRDMRVRLYSAQDEYRKKNNELLDIVEAKEKDLQKKIEEISAFGETLVRTRLMLEAKKKEAKQLKKEVEFLKNKVRIEMERNEILTEQYWELKEEDESENHKN
jgi:hypothetical protein